MSDDPIAFERQGGLLIDGPTSTINAGPDFAQYSHECITSRDVALHVDEYNQYIEGPD